MIKNKILFVDDQITNTQMIEIIFKDDYFICTENNSNNAIQTIYNENPDIILLDIHMPGMNGFELIKKIVNDVKIKDIPIIFLSGETSDEFKDKAFELGAVDYIEKPIKINEIRRKLKLWTKLKNNEKENLKNKKLFNEYKNTVDRSFIVSKTDKYGKITYVNDKFCEISGYSSDELIGNYHSIVRHEDMQKELFKNMWETIRSGRPWFGIVKNKAKNGKTYFVDTVINPIINENGEIEEYIGVRNDITELEEYKELLKIELSFTKYTHEENLFYISQYESAINNVNGVIKTNLDNKIIYSNKKFSEMIGFSEEELLGMNYFNLGYNDSDKKECKNIKNSLSKQEKVTALLRNRTKSGEEIFFNTLFSPIIDHNRNTVEYLHIMHDVTEIINLNKEIEDTQKEIILTMGGIGETRSKETGEHVKRVAEYSYLLAILYGLSEDHAQRIKQASPMHDIGKIGIPDDILNKPGKLTDSEFEIMKTHANLGYEMLKHSNRPILNTASIIAYSHHEKYDGKGYPNGLVGENIPIEGRITAIADVFDALGHDRCYKKAWELDDILSLFQKERGIHFDPNLIDLFINNLNQFLSIRDKFND